MSSVPNAEEMIQAMTSTVVSPTGKISVAPAFGLKGTYWGVSIHDGRKKVGMTLYPNEGTEQTPGNALRALADLLDAQK